MCVCFLKGGGIEWHLYFNEKRRCSFNSPGLLIFPRQIPGGGEREGTLKVNANPR